MTRILLPSLLALSLFGPASAADAVGSAPPAAAPMTKSATAWLAPGTSKLEAELLAKHGEAQRARLERGLKQTAALWRDSDGHQAAFEDFVRDNFAGTPATLDALFARFEARFEALDGHMDALGLALSEHTDLDRGAILPFDEAFAGYDPSAHLNDDLFNNKLAFVALLNFPLTTLDERLAEGPRWTRRQWAEARLAQRWSRRVPAEVELGIAQAMAKADRYISEYNLWMRHVLDKKGKRLFPAKLRLLSHWNLRDEIKAGYSEGPSALAKQRLIQTVMERIVTQTIPASVVNNPGVDWDPAANTVALAPTAEADGPARPEATADARPEPDTRYATLLNNFAASRKADPYSPLEPSLIARRFDEDRELPEARVRAMLEQVLGSPLVGKVGGLIGKRLGRKLEPFDIWYNGFKPRGAYTEAQLDAIVAKRYPTAAAFKDDIPNLLEKLGFPRRLLASHIVVEPARGSGHAWGARMRGQPAHLRTRVEKDGMNYKGFNIAVHEMGHNVEQTFSLYDVDHTLLQGVPNTAFTEALAFVFQGHDLELLGLAAPDGRAKAAKTLNDFWGTYEIAGVALVDMGVWHWMYDHPDAAPAQLKDATVAIAKDVWNRYYAPVFGAKDVVLLGVYSHMINERLYLPDYPLGHMIAFQVEQQMDKKGAIGPEFERVATFGSVAPDLWMINATGAPVGPEALLEAAAKALKTLKD